MVQGGNYDPAWGQAVSQAEREASDYYLVQGQAVLDTAGAELGVSLTIGISPSVVWPADFSLYVVLTDSVHYDGGNGETEHLQTMRAVLHRSYSAVTTYTLNFSGTFTSLPEVLTKPEVVAFLQDENTHQVLQAFKPAFISP